jgi:Flp pilus assembly pilin Flp
VSCQPLLRRLKRARALLRDESGQAMVEYAAVTTIVLLGGIALGASWPVTRALFEGLQMYVDTLFLWLNMAVG